MQLRTLLLSPSGSEATPPNSIAFLTQPTSTSSNSRTPLTTSSQFATSQLPALRQLVADLRPKIRSLKDKGIDNVDWESRREERRQYIEGGVRRVAGKGGFGGGEGEAMMDSIAGNGAERRGREEVEGLEGVIGGLGDVGGERIEE